MRLSTVVVVALGASCGPIGGFDGGTVTARCSSIAFEHWVTFDDVREVYTLRLADLDGDGTPDFFVGESTRDRVSLFLSRPRTDAGFERRMLPTVGGPIAVATFVHDGRLDLLAGGPPDAGVNLLTDVTSASPPAAQVLAGLGSESLSGLAQTQPGGSTVVVAASQFDVALKGTTVSADGALAPRFVLDAGNPCGPGITADFDGDHLDDAVFTDYFTGIAVLTSGSSFTVVPQATSDNLNDLSAGDLDGDGDLDVVQAAGTSIGVYLNDGTARFQATDAHASGSNFIGVATGDFDLDGRLDVVASQDAPVGEVDLFTYADGALTRVASLGADAGLLAPSHLVAADFDGDGRVDLAVTDRQAANLVVFRNVSPDCPLPADSGPRWLAVGCEATPPGAPAVLAAAFALVCRRRRSTRTGL